MTSPDDVCVALKIGFTPSRAFLWGRYSIAVCMIYLYGCDLQERGEKAAGGGGGHVYIRERQTNRQTDHGSYKVDIGLA